MKPNSSHRREEAFTILRTSFSQLNLPEDLVEELIERHIAVAFEKGAIAFCAGNTDGMLACVLRGYVNVYCPVGDGDRTLVRMAAPGEIIGYHDYVDEKGRHARLFEAQAASKCALALFSWDHVARLLAGLPADALITILTALNTFWSENLRNFTVLLNLPFWDRLTMVLSDLAKRAGARVITSDLHPARLTIAHGFGLNLTIDASKSDAAETVRGMTQGRGADAVILAVGGSGLIRPAMDAARPGGRVLLFAQTVRGEATIDPASVCVDEKALLGSYSASVELQEESVRFVMNREMDLERLISHRFPLSSGVEALNLAAHPQPDSMKIVIQPGAPVREGNQL